jgi:hypothetical protein
MMYPTNMCLSLVSNGCTVVILCVVLFSDMFVFIITAYSPMALIIFNIICMFS